MEKKEFKLGFSILLICSIISALIIMVIGVLHYANSQYSILSNMTQLLISKYPKDEHSIIKLIKDNSDIYHSVQTDNDNYLSLYGYEAQDFAKGYKEDSFSELQDEIYKTVTTLYKTREEAVAVKENYADNLANIAHQMKTPLTSMSLMTQLLKEDLREEHVEQLQKQIKRLTKMEEALLLLSRIDAGVLTLDKKNVDVYTMLLLAVDGLEELSVANSCEIKLENRGIVSYMGDMEWSIDAFSNLIIV